MRLDGEMRPKILAIRVLVDLVPPELITLQGQALAAYVCSVETIRADHQLLHAPTEKAGGAVSVYPSIKPLGAWCLVVQSLRRSSFGRSSD